MRLTVTNLIHRWNQTLVVLCIVNQVIKGGFLLFRILRQDAFEETEFLALANQGHGITCRQ